MGAVVGGGGRRRLNMIIPWGGTNPSHRGPQNCEYATINATQLRMIENRVEQKEEIVKEEGGRESGGSRRDKEEKEEEEKDGK